MKGFDLIKGIGYIDDDLAAEALEEKKVRPIFRSRSCARRWVAVAACLAVAVLAGVGLIQGRMGSYPAAQAPDMMATQEKNTSYTVGAVSEEAAEAAESIEEAETDAVSAVIADHPGYYGYACYEVPAPGTVGYSLPLQDAMAEYHGDATYLVYAEIFRGGEETPLAADDPETAALLDALDGLIRPGDSVLVKASRSMAFEAIVERLTGQ